MRLGSKMLLAGLGTLAVTGVAAAAEQKMHVLKVKMPDGTVERIRYTGDVPPRLVFVPVQRIRLPARIADEALVDPFLSFDRIFAEMNRRSDAMLRQAAAMGAKARATPGHVTTISTGSLPPGAVHYSAYTVTTSQGACSRSVQISSQGEGKPAKVVTQASGNCAAAPRAPAAPQKPAAPAGKGANAVPAPPAPVDARDTI